MDHQLRAGSLCYIVRGKSKIVRLAEKDKLVKVCGTETFVIIPTSSNSLPFVSDFILSERRE